MAFVNFATREITAKIVYYGPGLGGKTTSLQYIHGNLAPENRGKMISLATEEDRTIYFDFLPLNLGKIQDFAVRVQLYTVPGQVRYNATRKLVLRGADGLVFVADSQKHKKLANLESYNNMEENLRELSKDLRELPHVLQFNKADLPGIMNPEELSQILNKHNVPFYETVATTGIGVLDSLKSITKLVFNDLSKKALLQKKSRTTTGATEYTMGSQFGAQASVATALKTAPPSAPPPPPAPPPVPDQELEDSAYYTDKFDEPEEVMKEDLVDKMEDSYSATSDSYSELELEEQPAIREVDTSVDVEVETIEEVEPLDEFDEPSTGAEEAILDDETVVESKFDAEAEEAVFTVEEPVISVPIVPVEPDAGMDSFAFVEPQMPKEEPAQPQPRFEEPPPAPVAPEPQPEVAVAPAPVAQPQTRWSYADLFLDTPELFGLMQKMEQQAEHGDPAIALATARNAYDFILHQMFPESMALDRSETSKILVLDVNFRRFARFKALLWADPSKKNLLMVHHFLCELYLAVKEL